MENFSSSSHEFIPFNHRASVLTVGKIWHVSDVTLNSVGIKENFPEPGRGVQDDGKHRVLRILVVDDNKDAADILTEFLTAHGYDVKTEYHPSAALQRASVESFDAFVLDIGLPVLDGHELARELRTHHGAAEALFIAVTGYGSDVDHRRSWEAGFQHHLAKPASMAALLSALGPPRNN